MFKHNVLTGDEIINQSDRKLIGITSQEIFHKKACDSSYFLDSDKEIYCVFYPKISTIYLFIQKKKDKEKESGQLLCYCYAGSYYYIYRAQRSHFPDVPTFIFF